MTSSAKLVRQLERFVNKIDSDEHTLTDSQLKQFLENNDIPSASSVTITEYHVLTYIGDHPYTNAISISKALGITRGGISKIAARLLKKEVIKAQYPRNNKREISYTLTPLGEKLYVLHASLHKQKEGLLKDLLNQYTDTELECITSFLEKLMNII